MDGGSISVDGAPLRVDGTRIALPDGDVDVPTSGCILPGTNAKVAQSEVLAALALTLTYGVERHLRALRTKRGPVFQDIPLRLYRAPYSERHFAGMSGRRLVFGIKHALAPRVVHVTSEELRENRLSGLKAPVQVSPDVPFGRNRSRDLVYNRVFARQRSGLRFAVCVYSGRTVRRYSLEHLWPQSAGLDTAAARSDLLGLVPAESWFNSVRGSTPFGEVVHDLNPKGRWRQGRLGYDSEGYKVVQVMPGMRGEVSRRALGMLIKYGLPVSYRQFEHLRATALKNSVTAKERQRMDMICCLQGSRNPFSDLPELARRIRYDDLPSSCHHPVHEVRLSLAEIGRRCPVLEKEA